MLLVHKDRKECREAVATEDPMGSLETMLVIMLSYLTLKDRNWTSELLQISSIVQSEVTFKWVRGFRLLHFFKCTDKDSIKTSL